MNAVAFSRSGATLASGGHDGGLALWRVGEASASANFMTARGCKNAVTDACYTMDDECAVTSDADGVVRVWDAETGGTGEVVRVDAREVRERGERGERGFGDERERRRERVRVGFEGEKASGADVRARGAADGVRDERARGSRVRRRRGRRRFARGTREWRINR